MWYVPLQFETFINRTPRTLIVKMSYFSKVTVFRKYYLFSDCCSHVLVQYTNEESKVYRTVGSFGFEYADIFTVFEREEGTTNDRDHYKSLDGKFSIDYSDCGAWGLKRYDLRYEKLKPSWCVTK